MYVYWTLDDTSDLIGYMTLVLTDSTHMIYRLWWTPDIWFYHFLPILRLFMFAYYYSLIPVYSFISYVHTLYTCALFLLFYTLTGSLSDDLGFARSEIGCFYFIDQVFEEAGLVARSWSFSLPILILLSSFSFPLIL